MNKTEANHFDQSAAAWDAEPRRVKLAKAVGEAILRQVRPTHDMHVLDYGCGTGLLGLFLLPHVRSVTGVDSSPGMLRVLKDKIKSKGLRQMRTEKLDLQHDPIPEARYHLIVSSMVMHHVNQTDALLAAFYRMLLPKGYLAIADLDTEPGWFHDPEVAGSVFHHGFDRHNFIDRLCQAGFFDVRDVTAHVICKPIANGKIWEFAVFLVVGHRA
jgi:ubiquinone/menaquinone biosynthesis C-methylase UbiE